MISPTREKFLQAIAAYVQTDPLAAPLIIEQVIEAVQAGLSRKLEEQERKAADFEAALMFAIRRPASKGRIKEFLQPWLGKTVLDWTLALEEKQSGKRTEKLPDPAST